MWPRPFKSINKMINTPLSLLIDCGNVVFLNLSIVVFQILKPKSPLNSRGLKDLVKEVSCLPPSKYEGLLLDQLSKYSGGNHTTYSPIIETYDMIKFV